MFIAIGLARKVCCLMKCVEVATGFRVVCVEQYKEKGVWKCALYVFHETGDRCFLNDRVLTDFQINISSHAEKNQCDI